MRMFCPTSLCSRYLLDGNHYTEYQEVPSLIYNHSLIYFPSIFLLFSTIRQLWNPLNGAKSSAALCCHLAARCGNTAAPGSQRHSARPSSFTQCCSPLVELCSAVRVFLLSWAFLPRNSTRLSHLQALSDTHSPAVPKLICTCSEPSGPGGPTAPTL